MNFVTLMVHGPLAGAQKRSPNVYHAITTEAFIAAGLGQRMPTAPCGAKHLRFVAATGEEGQTLVVGWPIKAKGDIERCRDCWVATGKKRPRS